VYNQLAFTLACIHSVLSAKTRFSYEIIVADDRSTDRTTDIFSNGVGRIRHVLSEQNQGFIRNCNNAAKHARGRYLVLLNNDTIVLPGWLDELIEPLDTQPDIGLVGSKLLYPDGRLQESGGIIFGDGSGWNFGRMDDPRKPQYCYMRDADYVSGASIALPTGFWNSVGGFDEQYSVAYYEDTDMAFRVRQAGLRVVVQPLSQLLHFEGISSGTDTRSGAKQYQLTNAVTFKNKWSNVLTGHGQCDPAQLPADRTTRGRVLVIDACTPTPDRDAGSLETFQHLRILKSFGFNVAFAPENLAYFGRYTQDLQRMGIETLYAPYWMSFEEVLRKLGGSLDLVMIYRAPVANRLIDLVRSHAPQAKIIFDTIDLHFLREEREAALHNDPDKVKAAASTRKMELSTIERCDATIILSSHEMGIVHKLLPKAKLYEIPIVCTIPGKGPLDHAQRQDIVFIGGFRHSPNLDAVKWFVAEVWPLLRAKGFNGNFQIVGADMPYEISSLHGSGIVIRGHVPDIADVFNEIRLSVAPLRFGAGLKGKVISSLSFGVPVVATSVAVEGGGFTHEGNVLVADDPEEFADSIIRLYGDQGMWENLSHSGVSHCDRTFSVSVVSNKLRNLIHNIAPELPLKPDR
jgi:GT2 family glycosyltransferase/glycosyltransferase involved in cell wall biosynthesis